ncbi:IS66 family transposase [Polynucleobacter kasalickyi]|uniref:Transposase n=1 Tax=Polynucleobacter kasalickyi TaxID=1938817 RepID=A0A1W1Y5T1_9BURK|nr:IS66 family transposase [Polynucleobacter kasalickyi]SMC31181.1 Transposase [Polynucleobacter kasalickyi]
MEISRQLPDNVAELQAMLSAQLVQIDALALERDAFKMDVETLKSERNALKISQVHDNEEIKRLTDLIAKLRRAMFGQKSEKLNAQIDQFELELEELHITQGMQTQFTEVAEVKERSAPKRRPLPDHLPRQNEEHLPSEAACPDCGGSWEKIGEDVSEVLEYVPASYRVIRHIRPKLSCTCCDRMAQAPAPSRPIARSSFGPGLMSHVIISKYMDHLPIYRQCQQALREGIELSESTLGDVVGGVHQLLRPLIESLRRYVFAAGKLHADDTPINVLAPGNGKTKQGRLWVYTRDDRPAGDITAPAVWFKYSPDRKGIHPQTHLKDYQGILQADAYPGYNALFETGRVIEAACWAHARRKFYDIHEMSPTPISTHVLKTIGELYQIEAGIRGSPPERRREVRQELAKPIVEALHLWLKEQLSTVSRKSLTADAIGYAMNQWEALCRYLDNGLIEMDNNAAERALRTVALGRKNYLFLGSDAGGERAATMYSLLGTVKLNGINPEKYLRHVLSVIADYPVNKVSELLPWNVTIPEDNCQPNKVEQ